jgi:PKD repeat protein
MTLVETILAMSLSVLVLLPILGWAQFALGEQTATRQRNADGTGLGLLRSYLVRDVASADVARTEGLVAGCADLEGGDGARSAAPLLALDVEGATVDYTVAASAEPDGGTGAGAATTGAALAEPGHSLWRRTCAAPGEAATDVVEVVTGVNTAGTTVECLTPGPEKGTCRRITLRVLTGSLEQLSLTVAVRSDGPPGPTAGPADPAAVPTVALTAEPVRAPAGTKVRFSSDGSKDPDGGPLSHFWEFGDGGTSTEPDPVHVYPRPGRYTVVLTVLTAAGVPATEFVVVEATNTPPVAVIAAPAPGSTTHRGVPVAFSSKGSNDDTDAGAGGRIVAYRWDFGDGTGSDEPNPTKVFTALSPEGGFRVRLTVTDDLGATGRAEVRVTVANRRPVVQVVAEPASGTSPLVVRLSAVVEDEPGLQPPPTLTFDWDLGNGQRSTAATPPPVTYTGSGSRTVRLTVTDDAGEQGTDTRVVKVNAAPTAAFTLAPASGRAPLSVSFTNTSSDPDGAITAWAWDFGNGTTATTAGPGTRVFSVDDPASDSFVSATYTVTLTVTDDAGGSASTTRTVTVTGAPAPTNLRRTAGGTSGGFRYLDLAWNAVGNANRYQVNLVCETCSENVTAEFTTTSGRITGLSTARPYYQARVRARDTTTGKWGEWSPAVRVRS